MTENARASLGMDVAVVSCVLLAMLSGHMEQPGQTARLRTYWTDLRVDVDNLTKYVEDCGNDPIPDWMHRRLGDLHSRRVGIIPTEPVTDKVLLDRCYEDECRGRGVEPVARPE